MSAETKLRMGTLSLMVWSMGRLLVKGNWAGCILMVIESA